MKFFAIVALVATTQAAASAKWVIADATEGCDDETYECAVSSCTANAATDGKVCVPLATVTAAGDKVNAITPAPTAGSYDTDMACVTTAACTKPEASASALVASAAALATALYT